MPNPVPCACRPSRASRIRPMLFALGLVLALGTLDSRIGDASLGRWSPSQAWSHIAVHMALLPADGNPYHSRIVWWNDEDSNGEWYGGQWGWLASGDNIDCSSYPASKLVSLGLPSPQNNIFCAGLTHLPDGRLLTVGGTETGTENGLRTVNVFTAGAGSDSGSWSSSPPDSMHGRRWYPTATVLKDGRVLVTSGSEYEHIELFGGLTNAAATPSDSSLARYGLIGHGVWDAPAALTSPWPGPVFGHSAAPMPGFGTTVYFGGRTAINTLSGAVWFGYRDLDTLGSDYEYAWKQPTIVVDVPHPLADPRMFHSAIVYDDTNMVVFGGIAKHDTFPEALTDKALRLRRIAGDPLYLWQWEQLSTNSSPVPGARFAHRAVYDAPRHRMIVFGGVSDTTNGPADASVWALQLPTAPDLNATWSRLAVIDSATHPTARYDHSLTMNDRDGTYSYRNRTFTNVKSAILFGGRASGSTRCNDLWRLVFVGTDSVRWIRLHDSGTGPAPRSAHSAT